MYRIIELAQFPKLLHACSERSEGNMSFRWGETQEVVANRKKFLEHVGVRLKQCAGMVLNHGIHVERVHSNDGGKGMESAETGIAGDALCTNDAGVFLFLLTGDCLPIIFYDPVHSAVGLAHASRHNTPKFLMREVIMHMEQWFGTSPKEMYVGIGPGVRKESYRFPNSMREEFVRTWKGFLLPHVQSLQDATSCDDTKWKVGDGFSLDVEGWNIAQLKTLGVPKKNIFLSSIDTIVDLRFFSHCRSRRAGEPEGRIGTVVGIVRSLRPELRPRDG